MRSLNEKQSLKQVVDLLGTLLGTQDHLTTSKSDSTGGNRLGYHPDLIIKSGDNLFVVECKNSAQLGNISTAVEQLSRYQSQWDNTIKLLAVPFMGESGMNKCAEAGISWIDLSGNADVSGPGLRLYVRGKENKFKQPGRKENIFAPKSSRIARRLLYHPERAFTQRELALESGLGEGFVSRIVKTLEEQSLIIRTPEGRITARNRSVLLDAWAQGYDFSKHDVLRGHVTGRSGEEILKKLHAAFKAMNMEHAATGLGAAWLYAKFAAFRTVSYYLKEWPSDKELEEIGFRQDTAGANTWLIIPKDADVFHDIQTKNDVPCVHPIQVYLDLKNQPERADEAATELRQMLEL